LNFKDDHYANIALRIHNRTFSFRCLASSETNVARSLRNVFSDQSVSMCTLLYVKCC
jgi:lambda repressor-like predicted transcriptional regulator